MAALHNFNSTVSAASLTLFLKKQPRKVFRGIHGKAHFERFFQINIRMNAQLS